MSSDHWWVYMLRCADGSLYTGVATDVTRRLHEHNNSPRAARYTRSRRPVELVLIEAVDNRSEALKRESRIKSLKRVEKETLVRENSGHSQRYAEALKLQLAP